MNNLVGAAKPGFISSFLQHCLSSCAYEMKKKGKKEAMIGICKE